MTLKTADKTKKREFTMTPKGLILLSLGGFVAEYNGEKSKEKTTKICLRLADYMEKNNLALISKNKQLRFVNII